jgi:hypothetical protein
MHEELLELIQTLSDSDTNSATSSVRHLQCLAYSTNSKQVYPGANESMNR